MEQAACAREHEHEWLIKSEVPATIKQLTLGLERCMNLFKSNTKNPRDAKDETVKPKKYVFSAPHQEVMKAVVAVDGHRITSADISLRLHSAKSHSAPVQMALRESSVWPLQQILTSHQCVSRAVNLLRDTLSLDGCDVKCQGDASCMLMQQLEVLLSKAVDSLMIPDQWDLTEQARLNYQAGLRPLLPDDHMVVFYIHCSRLVLAVYTLTQAPLGTKLQVSSPIRAYVGSMFERGNQCVEVSVVNKMEVTMAWIAEVLCLLTTAQQLCQQLKEKVSLMR